MSGASSWHALLSDPYYLIVYAPLLFSSDEGIWLVNLLDCFDLPPLLGVRRLLLDRHLAALYLLLTFLLLDTSVRLVSYLPRSLYLGPPLPRPTNKRTVARIHRSAKHPPTKPAVADEVRDDDLSPATSRRQQPCQARRDRARPLLRHFQPAGNVRVTFPWGYISIPCLLFTISFLSILSPQSVTAPVGDPCTEGRCSA